MVLVYSSDTMLATYYGCDTVWYDLADVTVARLRNANLPKHFNFRHSSQQRLHVSASRWCKVARECL
jgi:hypothetical protein